MVKFMRFSHIFHLLTPQEIILWIKFLRDGGNKCLRIGKKDSKWWCTSVGGLEAPGSNEASTDTMLELLFSYQCDDMIPSWIILICVFIFLGSDYNDLNIFIEP